MKIHMGNVGMTLHVIHKLRARGIENVKVNMDWQHLIMNGENLAEYAALCASEGVLGHQHANSGWGTFDDDNMVGATAFMETLELAVELRRAGYGDHGERLGFDLYPYTEDAVQAVRRSVLQWRFIDGIAAKIDDSALREAQMEKDAVRAYELVYKAMGGEVIPARARERVEPGGSSRHEQNAASAAVLELSAPDFNTWRTPFSGASRHYGLRVLARAGSPRGTPSRTRCRPAGSSRSRCSSAS